MRLFQIPSFCLSVHVLQAGGSRRDHSGVTARTGQSVSTGASSGHFSACYDPTGGGGNGDKGGLCLAEQRKRNGGICGKSLQS